MKNAFIAVSLAAILGACSDREQEPKNDLESKAAPSIEIDEKELGVFKNHGRYLEKGSAYTFLGGNKSHTMFLYTDQGATITSFESGIDRFNAHSNELARLCGENEGLRGKEGWVTIFYAQGENLEEEREVIRGIYNLTFGASVTLEGDTKFRYMPHQTGSTDQHYWDNPRQITTNLEKGTLIAIGHGEIGVTFEDDEAFNLDPKHINYLPQKEHEEISRIAKEDLEFAYHLIRSIKDSQLIIDDPQTETSNL